MSSVISQTEPNVKPSTLFTGDNLEVLRGLDDDIFDLIYLDPPFNSDRDYDVVYANGANKRGRERAFKDTWTEDDVTYQEIGELARREPALYRFIHTVGDINGESHYAYLNMMGMRLIELRRVLKPTGSVYLHCDPTMSHSLKLVMDAIFGGRNFRNEIVWFHPDTPGRPRRDFARKNDIILRYVAGREWVFNADAVRSPIQADSVERYKTARVLGGRSYVGGAAATKGKVPETTWRMPAVKGNSRERVGWPTQKPLALLRRVIAASSNAGDWVLDPFCGSATACVAAAQLEREWVAIDISPLAVDLAKERLQNEAPEARRAVIARDDAPRRRSAGGRDTLN